MSVDVDSRIERLLEKLATENLPASQVLEIRQKVGYLQGLRFAV